MLELIQIKKSFVEPSGDRLPILDIPQFSLAEGEQMALVGRSGSGKTTLLHIIAGLARADEGTISIDGTDVTHLSEAARDYFRAQKLGYIFQSFNLLPGFTALENVMLGMTFGGGSDRSKAIDLLERVGLSNRMTHRPGQLSVGERQRVGVARALANSPRLMLADEPTASVDAKHQDQIIELIRDAAREQNLALILVTHADDVASRFDRVEHLENINQVVENV